MMNSHSYPVFYLIHSLLFFPLKMSLKVHPIIRSFILVCLMVEKTFSINDTVQRSNSIEEEHLLNSVLVRIKETLPFSSEFLIQFLKRVVFLILYDCRFTSEIKSTSKSVRIKK